MLKDRVKEIMQAEHLNAKDFAEKLGIQRSSLSHIYSGRNKPSLDFIVKVSKTFPEINMEWLLHGRGEMTGNSHLTADPSRVTNVTPVERKEIIPLDEAMPLKAKEAPKKVEKIILIFTDGTFKEVTPSKDI